MVCVALLVVRLCSMSLGTELTNDRFYYNRVFELCRELVSLIFFNMICEYSYNTTNQVGCDVKLKKLQASLPFRMKQQTTSTCGIIPYTSHAALFIPGVHVRIYISYFEHYRSQDGHMLAP